MPIIPNKPYLRRHSPPPPTPLRVPMIKPALLHGLPCRLVASTGFLDEACWYSMAFVVYCGSHVPNVASSQNKR